MRLIAYRYALPLPRRQPFDQRRLILKLLAQRTKFASETRVIHRLCAGHFQLLAVLRSLAPQISDLLLLLCRAGLGNTSCRAGLLQRRAGFDELPLHHVELLGRLVSLGLQAGNGHLSDLQLRPRLAHLLVGLAAHLLAQAPELQPPRRLPNTRRVRGGQGRGRRCAGSDTAPYRRKSVFVHRRIAVLPYLRYAVFALILLSAFTVGRHYGGTAR